MKKKSVAVVKPHSYMMKNNKCRHVRGHVRKLTK